MGLLFGAFIRVMFGQRWVWRYGVLWVELADPKKTIRGWPARTWYKEWGATTVGHVVMVNHGLLVWADHHEEVHDRVLKMASGEGTLLPHFLPIYYTLRLALHELTHVEQYESEAQQNCVVFMPAFAATGHPVIGASLWAAGGLTCMFSGFCTAFLRGEHPYKGSHNEEAASNAVSCKYPKELRQLDAAVA